MDQLSYIFLATTCLLFVVLLIVLLKKRQSKKLESDKLKTEFDIKLEEFQKVSKEQLWESKSKLEKLQRAYDRDIGNAISKIKILEAKITKLMESSADEDTRKYLSEAKILTDKVKELEGLLEKAKTDAENSTLQAEQIDKLNKKIKELEDDLDDAKEEADDANNNKKKIQNAYIELQEELDTAERNSKRYLQDFKDTKERLDELQNEFNLRVEALDFVTEILTAKQPNDESVISLYQNVDSTTDYINNEVRDVFKQTKLLTKDIEKKFFGTELESWAISKKKKWIQGKVTIAFVGEFSAGKTSIVNRILSQDDPNVPRLPVSTKATTAIPTYISGGIGTYYQFVTPNNELKNISESTFKRVSKEVLDQVKGVSSLIQYFVMTYKNPHLEKMSILDTPGFSSNDEEDKERTIGVINECDALFWVFDVNSGTVNRSSLKIIKEYLTKPLYIVINQIDTKSPKDVDAVEALIRKTLDEEGVKFNDIVRFSQKEPLHIIMDAIKNVSHDYSRELLLDDLIEFISDKSKEAASRTKSALQYSNFCQQKHECLICEFQNELHSLTLDCESVAKIPQFNSRFFSADDYRISQEQYESFGILLEQIGDVRSGNLADLYNKQIKAVEELELAWNKHSEEKKIQVLIQNCLDKLINKGRLFTVKEKHISSPMESFVYGNSMQGTKVKSASKTVTQTPNNVVCLSVNDFKSIFRWAIIEETESTVLMNWDIVKSILDRYVCNNISNNQLQISIPFWGTKDHVALDSLVKQIGTYMNQHKK